MSGFQNVMVISRGGLGGLTSECVAAAGPVTQAALSAHVNCITPSAARGVVVPNPGGCASLLGQR